MPPKVRELKAKLAKAGFTPRKAAGRLRLLSFQVFFIPTPWLMSPERFGRVRGISVTFFLSCPFQRCDVGKEYVFVQESISRPLFCEALHSIQHFSWICSKWCRIVW